MSNQEQYYSWFDAIFVLVADPATLRQRLLSRDGYGKHPAELAGILDGHAGRTAGLLSAAHAVAADRAVASCLALFDQAAGAPGIWTPFDRRQ